MMMARRLVKILFKILVFPIQNYVFIQPVACPFVRFTPILQGSIEIAARDRPCAHDGI